MTKSREPHTAGRLLLLSVMLFVGQVAFGGDVPPAKIAYVTLEGCPTAIPLQIPAAFTRASNSKQERLRDDVIRGLHANPYRKMRYSELFKIDWERGYGMPTISVASLGTLIHAQGRITEQTWREIKRELLTSSTARLEELMRRGRETIDPGNPPELASIRTRLGSLFEETADSVVILASHELSLEGIPMRVLGAAKVIYTRQCVAYVEVSVDATDPEAMRSLNEYVRHLKVM